MLWKPSASTTPIKSCISGGHSFTVRFRPEADITEGRM